PNMRIKSIEAIPLAASFKEVFRFGMTDRTSSPNVLVRIVADEGVVGWGEACPVQAFTSETQASVVELVETRVATALVGRDPLQRVPLLDALARVLRFAPFTFAAVDTALLDVAARHTGLPVSALLGGALPARSRHPLHGRHRGGRVGSLRRRGRERGARAKRDRRERRHVEARRTDRSPAGGADRGRRWTRRDGRERDRARRRNRHGASP